MPIKVMITGGAGAVGSAIIARMLERDVSSPLSVAEWGGVGAEHGCSCAQEDFDITSFDVQPTTASALDGGGPWPAGAVKSVVGDVSDFDEVKAAMEGQDAVIHLANGGSDWESNLKSNLIGTYNIFENAALCGVKRVATASRAGVTGQPNDGEGSPCECSSPRSHPLCPQEAAAQIRTTT